MMGSSQLTKKLNLLGLDDKEAQIYLCLLKSGILSPLELSRKTEIKRGTIYRVLEQLRDLGLVDEVIDEKKTRFEAIPPEKLESIVSLKETKLESIKNELPSLIAQLNSIKQTLPTGSKVLYYRGKKGLQQMVWNVTKADPKMGFLGFGYFDWNKSIGKKFAEKVRQEMVSKRIPLREILNESPGNDFTDAADYFKFYQKRVILKSLLEINHNIGIFNDVLHYNYYFQGETFGIEIHNKEIANTQRQLFEMAWKQAKKVKYN